MKEGKRLISIMHKAKRHTRNICSRTNCTKTGRCIPSWLDNMVIKPVRTDWRMTRSKLNPWSVYARIYMTSFLQSEWTKLSNVFIIIWLNHIDRIVGYKIKAVRWLWCFLFSKALKSEYARRRNGNTDPEKKCIQFETNEYDRLVQSFA